VIDSLEGETIKYLPYPITLYLSS